jgi:putative tricarboxylic transport membrane protein
VGTPRLTFGIYDLAAGIGAVPALVGLFGFSEVLMVISEGAVDGKVSGMVHSAVRIKDMLKHWALSLYACVIGTVVGALPGAGGPVASFLAYGEARRIIRKPSAPFGEGAVEGIVASESANNACIGGALIPMLTLAIPGDAVTAIILSVFYVHGLRPGPMFLKTSPGMFQMILAGGFLGCIFLLVLGLAIGPRIGRIIAVPKRLLVPVITVLCVIGSFAANNRMFDVALMFVFGVAGYLMRRRGYAVAPMTLALVLGNMMDSEFRRAVSLAVSEDALLPALFGRPLTIILTLLTLGVIISNIPGIRRRFERKSNVRNR